MGFTTGSRGSRAFIFDPRTKELRWMTQMATAVYHDMLQDLTFYTDIADMMLYAVDDDFENPMTYQWRSKVFQTPDTDFSVVKVWTDDPANVGFKLWVDGRETINIASLPAQAFRLPRGRGTRWQFELTGTARVERVTLAQSMAEVAG